MIEIKNEKRVVDIINSNGTLSLTGNITVQDERRTYAHMEITDGTDIVYYDVDSSNPNSEVESLRGKKELKEEARTFALATLTEFDATYLNPVTTPKGK